MLDSISYMQLAILSALDMFSYGSYMKMLFTFSLSNRMACFITTILVMLYLVFLLIKSFGKLLIFPTIQKPYYRQFTPSGFAASMRPPMFEGIHYKRWRVRAVLWFQTMSCYDATLGKPEGELDAQQAQAFQKMDTLFKAALLSVLGENIVDAYASIDNGKDMWDALEAKFGDSDAGTELYIMEQFYDYRMTEERFVVEQAHEIQLFVRELEHFSCTLPDKFVAGGIITKLPPSWRNFTTLLKHKRQEFFVPNLIGALDVEQKAIAKDIRARCIEGGSGRKTSSPTSSRTRASLMVKQSLMERTRLCNTRTSRRRMARRKVLVMCVGILIIGLLVALIAMTSVILGKATRPLMLSLETLT